MNTVAHPSRRSQLARILDWLDDALNPIVVKELRQAVQARIIIIAILLYLGVQLLVMGGYLLYSSGGGVGENSDFGSGRGAFFVLHWCLLLACMLLIPAYAGVRMAVERSDTNVDLLFISSLKPRAIISGKLLAAVVLMILLFSTSAPFMLFTYLLRGIDLPTIGLILLIDFLAVLTATMFAIFVGSLPTGLVFKAFLGVLSIGGHIAIISIAGSLSFEIIERGAGTGMEEWQFWAALGTSVAVTLLVVGQFFVWSVALITPTMANVALVPRLFLLLLWVVGYTIAASWSYQTGFIAPLAVWVMFIVSFCALQVLISINERETWRPRVAKAIPQAPWRRPLHFLFFSGSAGGVIFSVFLGGSALLACVLWEWYLLPPQPRYMEDIGLLMVEAMSLILTLTVCYSLSAVFIRNLFSEAMKTVPPWVLALVLLAIGIIGPRILALSVGIDLIHDHPKFPWWGLTDPFLAVYEISRQYQYLSHGRRSDFGVGCWSFLSVWLAIMTLLSLPWIHRQIVAFKPPPPSAPAATSL